MLFLQELKWGLKNWMLILISNIHPSQLLNDVCIVLLKKSWNESFLAFLTPTDGFWVLAYSRKCFITTLVLDILLYFAYLKLKT